MGEVVWLGLVEGYYEVYVMVPVRPRSSTAASLVMQVRDPVGQILGFWSVPRGVEGKSVETLWRRLAVELVDIVSSQQNESARTADPRP